MIIKQITPATFPLEAAGKINTADLNSFTKAVSIDIEQISALINEKISKPMRYLPIDPETEPFDGAGIYVDHSAEESKDAGIFVYTDPQTLETRPATIYETFLAFAQILANSENGLREGAVIEESVIANGGSITVDWPYSDNFFDAKLFEVSGDSVTKADLDIAVSASNKTLTITNNTGSDINVKGAVWHPVFNF